MQAVTELGDVFFFTTKSGPKTYFVDDTCTNNNYKRYYGQSCRSLSPSSIRTMQIIQHTGARFNYSLSAMESIQSLNVTGLKLESIAAIASGSLKAIDLSFNELTELSSNIFPGQLLVANVSHNKLANLSPDAFRESVELTHLILSYNNLRILSSGFIASLPNLKVLAINDNLFTRFQADLFRNAEISHLFLQNNYLSAGHIALHGLTEEFDVSNNPSNQQEYSTSTR